jgi:hypothetical protein
MFTLTINKLTVKTNYRRLKNKPAELLFLIKKSVNYGVDGPITHILKLAKLLFLQ